MTLEKNTAMPFQLEDGVTELFIANPDIADIQQANPKVAYIYAKKPGVTTIFATNNKGHVTTMDLTVTHNLSGLQRTLKSLYSQESITTTSSPAGIILSGPVSTPQIAKDVERLAQTYIGTGEKVVNEMKISTPTQLMLKVKIAEVARSTLTRLGVNWNMVFSPDNIMFGIVPGSLPFANGAFQLPGGLTPPPLAGYAFQFQDSHTLIQGVVDLLDQEGLVQVLAEPNLVCTSGETASFLVGGEIPIPVPQGNQTFSVEFKQYGISLAFTPTVLSPHRINLRVRPEVSDLDLDPSHILQFSIGGLTTAKVPAFKTRKAETSVELGSGQGFVIAGLIANNIRSQISQLPGIAHIPILGALFRSTLFQRDETELVIIVTPYIVRPSPPCNFKAPTDNLRFASTLEMLFLHELNRPYDPCENPEEADRHLVGCGGFYIE
jgi:pilus assembly protein CpaC